MATEITSNEDGWIDFVHDGKRWSFDQDQVAQWVEEDETFEFFDYHGLVDPTVESVIQFIDNL